MVPKTQTRSMIAEDEHPHSSTSDAAELGTMRAAGKRLSAQLDWLPGASSNTFSERCRKIAVTFKGLFAGVDAAFAEAPSSEDLLWLRDNAQQLSSEVRAVAADLGPLTNIPHAATRQEILPRVLAIAQAFFDETDATFSESEFLPNFVCPLKTPCLSIFMRLAPWYRL